MRLRSAPVNAPFSWPNNSLSSSVSGMAAQLMARNGRVGPLAVLIDRPGDQLLAGAALAADQHGDVLRRHPADRLVHLLHGRTAADQHVGRSPATGSSSGITAGTRMRRLISKARADEFAQLLQLQRLEEVVEGPELHRLDGCVRRPVAGDEDDRDLGVALMDAAEDVQTGEVGQRQIQEHDVGVVLGDHGQPFRRRGRRQHGDVRLLKAPSEGIEDSRLIIDHEQNRHAKVSRIRWYPLRPLQVAAPPAGGGQSRPPHVADW